MRGGGALMMGGGGGGGGSRQKLSVSYEKSMHTYTY